MKESIEERLRRAVGKKLDADLLRDTLLSLDTLGSCIQSMIALQRLECDWRVPLSDGVRAEVKIYGPVSAEHVKAFATIFRNIADNYVAPPPLTPDEHGGQSK